MVTDTNKLKEAFKSSITDGNGQKYESVYMTANKSISVGNKNVMNVEMIFRADHFLPRQEGLPPAGFYKFNPETASFERERNRADYHPEVFTQISKEEALQKAQNLMKRFGPQPKIN